MKTDTVHLQFSPEVTNGYVQFIYLVCLLLHRLLDVVFGVFNGHYPLLILLAEPPQVACKSANMSPISVLCMECSRFNSLSPSPSRPFGCPHRCSTTLLLSRTKSRSLCSRIRTSMGFWTKHLLANIHYVLVYIPSFLPFSSISC